jgi:hypothetical protein
LVHGERPRVTTSSLLAEVLDKEGEEASLLSISRISNENRVVDPVQEEGVSHLCRYTLRELWSQVSANAQITLKSSTSSKSSMSSESKRVAGT